MLAFPLTHSKVSSHHSPLTSLVYGTDGRQNKVFCLQPYLFKQATLRLLCEIVWTRYQGRPEKMASKAFNKASINITLLQPSIDTWRSNLIWMNNIPHPNQNGHFALIPVPSVRSVHACNLGRRCIIDLVRKIVDALPSRRCTSHIWMRHQIFELF